MTIYLMRLGLSLALVGALVAATAFVVIAAPQAQSPIGTTYNQGGDNLSSWAAAVREAGYEMQAVVASISLLQEIQNPQQVLFVVPSLGNDTSQAVFDALQTHLDRGGSVWVATREGHANPWLVSQGVSILEAPLLDSRSTNPKWVNATVIGDTERSITSLAPSSLLVNETAGWTPVLLAPKEVHIDILRDGAIDAADRPGPHIVAAKRIQESGGTLLVSADASMLTDQVWDSPQTRNEWIARDLMAQLLPNHGQVVVDETRTGWTTREAPNAYATRLITSMAFAPVMIGWMAVGAVTGLLGLVVWRHPAIRPFRSHTLQDPVVPPEGRIADSLLTDSRLGGNSDHRAVSRPPRPSSTNTNASDSPLAGPEPRR